MDRPVFAARLEEAAGRARALAGGLVLEPLPEKIQFRVRLNRSYPGAELQPGEVTFPGDGGWEQDFVLRRSDLEAAVSALWRQGMVPEWVDLAVTDRDESATLVEAVCCRRFTISLCPSPLASAWSSSTSSIPASPPAPLSTWRASSLA